MQAKKLENYLQQLLEIDKFKDYCPNGLQVQGKLEVKKIVTGVSASLDFIKQAIAANADAIIVHHGIFWQGDKPVITGMQYERIKTLITNNLSLFAYHLPLDSHAIYGNNQQLGKLLEINSIKPIIESRDSLVFSGELKSAVAADYFAALIEQKLNRKPLAITTNRKIKTLAWCTGAAQGFFNLAIAKDFDAYLTGEASEQNFHQAKESNVNFFACGHHATERYGVKALGSYLAKEFNLQHEFIDIDNPI